MAAAVEPPSNQCIFCQEDSIEQRKRKKFIGPNTSSNNLIYIQCSRCGSQACYRCVTDVYNYVSSKNSQIPSAISCDKSFIALSKMHSAVLSLACSTVDGCTSCSLRQRLTPKIHYSITRPPRPPKFTSLNPLPGLETRSSAVKNWRKNKKRLVFSGNSLEDLHRYHDSGPDKNLTVHCPCNSLSCINAKRESKGKKAIVRNPYEGILFLPMFGVGFQPDADEAFWRCDHMCLAPSKKDGTPGVLHGTPSHSCTLAAHKHMLNLKGKPATIEDRGCVIELDVPSPECNKKKKKRRIQVIVLSQIRTKAECVALNIQGVNEFTPEEILGIRLFGGDNMRSDVDATVVLGHFDLEHLTLPPKFLMGCWNGMHANKDISVSTKRVVAQEIYNTLRPIAGRGGYEMRRFCGSSGVTDEITDRNILRALSVCEGSLPRKSWATVIIRGKDRYYLVYRRVRPRDGVSVVTHAVYSPPRDGGQFQMPEVCLSKFFVLGEMSYQKMLMTELLKALNVHRKSKGQLPTATGPLERELRNIEEARKAYSASMSGRKMHEFISTFNKLNGYSMVAHPVGMHHDHFRDNESIENKIMFVLPLGETGGLGRGGSITGDKSVFVLLDW